MKSNYHFSECQTGYYVNDRKQTSFLIYCFNCYVSCVTSNNRSINPPHYSHHSTTTYKLFLPQLTIFQEREDLHWNDKLFHLLFRDLAIWTQSI